MTALGGSRASIIFRELFIGMILVVVLPTTVLGVVASGKISTVNTVGSVALMCVMMFMPNVLNNYADWEIDEINGKRASLHRMLNRRHLLWLTLILFLVSIPFFVLGNAYLRIVMLVCYFMIFNYNLGIRAKNVKILNYFFIALYYGPLAYAVGFFFSSADAGLFLKMIWIPVFLLLIDLGFSVTKDYEDVKGDRELRKMTLPVVFGKKKSVAYQYVMTSVAFSAVVVPVIFNLISPLFLSLLVFYAIALHVLNMVRSTDDKDRYHFSHNLIRFDALLIRSSIAFLIVVVGFQI